MNNQEKFQLINDLLTTFSAIYIPKARPFREEIGLPPNWFLLWVALEYEPDTISPRKAHIRTPYANLANLERIDRELAEQGLLVDQGNQEYLVEPVMRAKLKQMILTIETTVAAVDVLTPAELYTLEIRLAKVVQGALNSPYAEPYAIRLNNHSNPSISAPSILKIFQYLTDLSAWRDDAHVAAFKPYNVTGIEWECFSFAWRGEKNTPAAVFEDRGQARGYTVEDYAATFESLVKKGWLEADPTAEGAYRATEQGRKIREEAEVITDRNYFVPFEALGAEAAEEVWESLLHLHTAVKGLVPVEQPA
ncbi:MAG: hypothetical protein HY862_04945 [Chloroflexi bacterium]|nr:hypothetical protein [Chloroflexota bacterium]